MTTGYVVVDTETTGLSPAKDRVIEIGAVMLRADGSVEDEWSTLLNPERDLGPVHIHGIHTAEVLNAPHFDAIAGDLSEVLANRVIIGHNVGFDVRFLEAEYRREGWEVDLPYAACLCTMQMAGKALPHIGRKLAVCCSAMGISIENAHCALDDAQATALLFQRLAPAFGGFSLLPSELHLADRLAQVSMPWIPATHVPRVQRTQGEVRQQPFLDRLSSQIPPIPGAEFQNQYLALLDRALMDRFVSHREADALVALADELGLGRETVAELHGEYLRALVELARADDVITDQERADLDSVVELLGIDPAVLSALLTAPRRAQARAQTVGAQTAGGAAESGGQGAEHIQRPARAAIAVDVEPFKLNAGDMIVFTGAMAHERSELEAKATAVGLLPHAGVTKKVKLVVAADPDSMSGKAQKAANYGIPIVTEAAFLKLVDAL